jgi:hypothetical protein
MILLVGSLRGCLTELCWAGCRAYSRDWLLTFRDQCTALPVGLEGGSDVMREGGQGPPGNIGRGPGGAFDQRPRGGPPPQGPPGIGMGTPSGLDDKHWKRGTMRGPEGMPPIGPPGVLHPHCQGMALAHVASCGASCDSWGSS